MVREINACMVCCKIDIKHKLYYEIQYYCIENIVHDRNLSFNNKEYIINLHINCNIISFNHLEKQNTQKTFTIMIATNFDNLRRC